MPLINPTLPNDGESADAADISGPFLALLAVINGHIGADNLEPGILNSTNLASNSVTTPKIADGSITLAKLNTVAGQLGGASQAWVPSFTNWAIGTGGAAATVATYLEIGKLVFFWIRSTLGTSGTTIGPGTMTFSLPITAKTELYSASNEGYYIGTCKMLDATVKGYPGRIQLASTTTAFLVATDTSGPYAAQATQSPTVPFNWGVGDMWLGSGMYERA